MTGLHPERGGYNGTVPKYGVVVHDSEGGENSVNLLNYLASPGDRPNSSGTGRYGGGYNAVATETGGYVQIALGDRSPYHAPPLNATWWSICIPGRANQTRDQWLDTASRAYIKGVALFIVDMWRLDGESWPLTKRVASELVAGERGITSHAEVSKAWHKTDHTDPGPSFPWDVLAADIAALVLPPVEEHPIVIPEPLPPLEGDVRRTLFIPTDCDAQFIGWADSGGNAIEITWVTKAVADAHRSVGVAIADQLSFGGFGNCVLLGPLPTGDSRHQWTGQEFFRWVPGAA